MAKTRRRRVVGRGPKRNLFWARGRFTVDSTAGRYAQLDMLKDFNEEYGASIFGFTVTRMILNLANWEGDKATQNKNRNTIGIRVGDKDTMKAFGNQVQNLVPLQDPYSDWMFVHNWSSVNGVGTSREIGYRHEWDLKSQRKLSELGQSLFILGGRDTTDGGWFDVDYHILLKQP